MIPFFYEEKKTGKEKKEKGIHNKPLTGKENPKSEERYRDNQANNTGPNQPLVSLPI